MGLTTNCAKFLFYSLRQGVSFTETIMLGRQDLYSSEKDILGLSMKNGIAQVAERIDWNQRYAEPVFELLGATKIDSLDYSDYEKASIIHDLNFPLPSHLKNKYTVVFDGGTLEHVFNFPEALKSCMEMIKPGGHFISITPANNQCGHGFYQLSPELFFSTFSKERGFQVKALLLAVDVPDQGIREWYEVSDPKEVKSRVTLSNGFPTYIMVLAKKLENIALDNFTVYQSDYAAVWNTHEIASSKMSYVAKIYKAIVPLFIRDSIYRLRKGSAKEKNVSGLGKVNPLFFKKIKES